MAETPRHRHLVAPLLVLIVCAATALLLPAVSRSLLEPQITSHRAPGQPPIAELRVATFEGEVTEIWIQPVPGTRMESLVAEPPLDASQLPGNLRVFPPGTALEQVLVDAELREQLRALLPARRLVAVQILRPDGCSAVSLEMSRHHVRRLLVTSAAAIREGCGAAF